MGERTWIQGVLMLYLIGTASTHAAEQSGFYAGLGVGQAKTKADDRFDDSVLSFRLVAGYSIWKYFGG